MRGHFNSREVTARQPTRERLVSDELQNRTAVKLYKMIKNYNQLSKQQNITIADFHVNKLFHYKFHSVSQCSR